MNHPEAVQLLEYLEQPDGVHHAATLDHLSDCVDCRTRAARLAALQTQVQRHVAHLRGAYDTHTRLRAGLHSAIHGVTLRRDLLSSGAPPPAMDERGLFQRITGLFTLRLPRWIPAAATAAVVVAVLSVPIMVKDGGSAALAAYQDAPVMHFQSGEGSQPGIGFFSGANRVDRPFTGVDVTRPEARTLVLRWPVVDNAVEYRVSVSHVDGNARQHVAGLTTTEPLARIVNFDFVAHSRYEWVIEGQARDGMRFSATGGFVVP